MGHPRLTWLKIHEYRHVARGTHLEFGAGFNVLLGRNGTGKTTLLELIEMIWAKGFDRIAKEPFHLEYAVELDALEGGSIPRCLIEVEVENSQPEASQPEPRHGRGVSKPLQFKYQIVVRSQSGEQAMRIKGTPLQAILTSKWRSGAVAVLGPSDWPIVWAAPSQYFNLEAPPDTPEADEKEIETLSSWAEQCVLTLETVFNEGRYDESLGAFSAMSISGSGEVMGGMSWTRWEIERRIDQQAKVYPIHLTDCRFFPHRLQHRWADELIEDPKKEPPEFQSTFQEVGLGAFLELTGYQGGIVKSGTPSRERGVVVEKLRFHAPEFWITLPNAEIPAQELSYGEKRLLAFLWYLQCYPTLVIADELVNGFHHEWIERCIELIHGRQAFLASQNPLLLDCLPLDSKETVRRSFITCRRGEDGRMEWKNLTEEEAADFYRAYERQTRYTHEILRGKGLW